MERTIPQDFRSLVEQVQNGSAEAMAELVEGNADAIHRIVRRRLHQQMRSQFDTADFAQIVWASFFSNLQRLADFDGPEQLQAYLARMAEHKVIDACRRRMVLQKNNVNRERTLNGDTASTRIDLASNDPTPSHKVAIREEWDRLMNRLPEHHRRIIALRASGCTFQEIADELTVHERTVRRVLKNLGSG